jgi:hypothetical protein
MPNEIQEQNIERKRKAKKIFLNIVFFCLGLFLFAYGFIAMFFNFKVGLLICALGVGILFFLLYYAYNPK